MENKRIYIVSFGDSGEYAVAFSGTREELMKSDKFRRIVDELKECIKKNFPEGNFEGLVSPKVREANHTDKDYPELTPDAVRTIKHQLEKEGEMVQDNRQLNRDAPYSDVQ